MGCRQVTVIIFIFTAILVPVLVGECVDWLPWTGTRLIRRAANRLPIKYRARYEEEWQAEFNALPGGKLTKLLFGLRICANARSTGAALQAEIDMEAARRAMLTAALAQLAAFLVDGTPCPVCGSLDCSPPRRPVICNRTGPSIRFCHCSWLMLIHWPGRVHQAEAVQFWPSARE
jgi:hypothetical protein